MRDVEDGMGGDGAEGQAQAEVDQARVKDPPTFLKVCEERRSAFTLPAEDVLEKCGQIVTRRLPCLLIIRLSES